MPPQTHSELNSVLKYFPAAQTSTQFRIPRAALFPSAVGSIRAALRAAEIPPTYSLQIIQQFHRVQISLRRRQPHHQPSPNTMSPRSMSRTIPSLPSTHQSPDDVPQIPHKPSVPTNPFPRSPRPRQQHPRIAPGDGATPCQYELEKSSAADPGKRRRTDALVVSPDYFAALEIQPVQGRIFTPKDGLGSPVVIVNQGFASKHWPQ